MTVLTTITSGTAVTTETIYPLTTTFVPPAACSGIQYDSSNALWVVNEFDSTTCLPTGFELSGASYFSPGLVCPSGYYTACLNAVATSITTVTCCPVVSSVSLTCKASITETLWSSQWCTWSAGTDVVTLEVTSDDSTSDVVFTSADGINAWAVRLVYEPSDLVTTTTTSSSSGDATSTSGASASTPTRTSVAATSQASTSTSNASKSGLSAGAAAGIGIAVAVAAIAAAGGAFWYWQRRRKNNSGGDGSARQPPNLLPSELASSNKVAEMYTEPPELFTQPTELHGTLPSRHGSTEGASPQALYEMDQIGSAQRYEMP